MFLNLFKMRFFLSFFIAQLSMASEIVVHERQVILPVNISAKTIILSRAGYSLPLVKVLLPELAEVTLLNHRNESAGAPCMKTNDTSRPSDIIQNSEAVENVVFTVTLTKHATPNEVTQSCYVSMSERITGKIRGFEFEHELYEELPARDLSDCK